LLSLVGMGGVGKTRLALAVASQMGGTFADGVYIVALAPIRDPDLVAPALAQVLGVQEISGRTLLAPAG